MQTIEVHGRSVPLGPKGFVADFDDWDEEVARAMARNEGLELQDCHWKAITFIREFFRQHEIPPTPRILIKEVGEQLHEYRCTYGTLKTLFPDGGCKQACRLAGLPDYYCASC